MKVKSGFFLKLACDRCSTWSTCSPPSTRFCPIRHVERGEGREGGRERTHSTHAFCLRRQVLSPSICNVCVRARVHVHMHTHARKHTHACVAFRVGNVERRENCRRIQQGYLETTVDWKDTRCVPGPVFRGSVLMVVWAAGCRGASCSRNADSGCARNVAPAHLLGGFLSRCAMWKQCPQRSLCSEQCDSQRALSFYATLQ
jgi:hypothetical protein